MRLSCHSRILHCVEAFIFEWLAHQDLLTQLSQDHYVRGTPGHQECVSQWDSNACDEAAAHVAVEWDFGRLIDMEDKAGLV